MRSFTTACLRDYVSMHIHRKLTKMVLPERIELSTSPLPRECSTTELRQRPGLGRAPRELEAHTRGHDCWQGKLPGPAAAGRGLVDAQCGLTVTVSLRLY